MNKRKFLGWFGFISFVVGASMLLDPVNTVEYSGIYPKWFWLVLTCLWWVWVVVTPIALLMMASGENTRNVSSFAALLWTFIFIFVIIDSLSSKMTHVTLTTSQILRTMLLIFVAPAMTIEDSQHDLLKE